MTQRVALFVDYENFYTALRQEQASAARPYGATPRLDFEQLARYVTEQFGPLAREDFVVVANFAHYDPQKGGLNRLSTLVDADSFEDRHERQQTQASPGKRHVVPNYADLRLAFEIGQHAATRPAATYLIASGDGAFAAVGRALQEQGREVIFLLASPPTAALLIKNSFKWIPVPPLMASAGAAPPAETAPPAGPPPAAPVDELCATLTRLRRELTSAIPVGLVEAIFGVAAAEQLIKQAHGQGKVDTWKDPTGILCVSLREDRLRGKIAPMPVRPALATRAALLQELAHIVAAGLSEPTEVQWRRALPRYTGLSVKAAKRLLEILLEMKILRYGEFDRLYLPLPVALDFLRREDMPEPPPRVLTPLSATAEHGRAD